ncbi:MAG: hypothetical protein QGH42_11095 [Kiritimatiellia bacterium]|nr:hypothetical protein [Kiritimatiellia bacterium]MDP6631042.1 hypothetical protein [Kiritimatiellia bacterium]MDP6809998.1 hypothetical protein [Kiritimatiellia bacterium]MDP7024769.1 hypothetical protein [Kiritimatiellia bacterium]
MNENTSFDFWYAVNNTEIILMPGRHLETFGATVLNYRLISEMMDSVNQIRVREGRIQAHQPHIITPEAYSETILEGFGEQAENYVNWLKQHEQDIRILQYGYTLKQEAFSEHIITDNIKNVVERIKGEVEAGDHTHTAVVQGVDDPWDVCLVKLFWEVIRQSAAPNIRELQKRRMFEDDRGVPRGVRNEIEAAFSTAARDPSLIEALAHTLQRYNLFEDYEDRFFSLVRGRK